MMYLVINRMGIERRQIKDLDDECLIHQKDIYIGNTNGIGF